MYRLRFALPMLLVVTACAGSSTPTTTSPASGSTTAPTTTSAGEPEAVRDLTFRSGGLTLVASLWPGGTTWVVLGHMRPGDKDGWTDLATVLQEAGYSVLAYNNRGYGASEGTREPFALDTDAAAAIQFASDNGASRIVYGGASMNGANAMKLGAFYEFPAIIVLSGIPSFPSATDAIGWLYDVDEPILFVAAKDDGTAVSDTDDFLDRAGNGHWIILEEGGHGTDMLTSNPDLAQQIVDWLMERVR